MPRSLTKKNNEKGFTLLAASVFLAFILTLGIVSLNYSFSLQNTNIQVAQSALATQLAQAGIEKAIRCLNATSQASCGSSYGMNYAGETNTTAGNGSFTVTVTGTGNNRTVASTGQSPDGTTSTVKISATTIPDGDDGLIFTYALQVGDQGATIANNATVNGTVYSNGNITCQSTNGRINGDAYVAVADGSISNCRVDYDAHADRILSSTVYRNAYFRTNPSDITGTTVSGTKYPNQTTPTSTVLPDVDLDFWHQSAEAGGTYSGNYQPASGTTIGPLKIDGNLTITNGAIITLAGPIWVTGNISISNNASVRLSSTFGTNSTVVLADNPTSPSTLGRITITNNVTITGSGNSLSHILFISTNTSTSDSTPAIDLGNNTTGAIFYATLGSIRVQNNAAAKSLVAKRLNLTNNASITYVQSQMTGTNFSNSPGGSWRIETDSWRRTE